MDPAHEPHADRGRSSWGMEGAVCLVTGSSRGIGRALARALGLAGGVVVVNGRDPDRAEATAAAFSAEGIKAVPYPFDVTDEAAVEDAVERIEREVGPVDVLVNNAGITVRAPAEEISPGDWNRVMDVNVTAVFRLSRIVGVRMIARRKGKIIVVASLMSERARPGVLAYTVSKGAVRMLVKSLAVEWGKYNVQVNGIGPGYIETELTAPLREDPAFDAWVREKTPAGRWGRPEDLGGTAVFLASSMSDFVNGQIIYVDGGWLAGI